VGNAGQSGQRPGRWTPRATACLIGATAALLAAVYVLRTIHHDARDGVAFLYAVPVALAALRFGWRGGFAVAVIATLLVALDSEPQLTLSTLGYATRVAIVFMVGLLVGWFVDRERRWQELREREQAKVRRFFELSQDMLCTADADGYLVNLNPAWQRVLGYTEEELRAQPFVDLVHPNDREQTLAEAAAIFDGDATVDFTNRYLAKDGSAHWLRWSSVLADDGLIYARATDVTAAIGAAEKLRETADELERSNDDLRQFAYIASHDLNEPLRTIAGFAQLLQKRYEDKVDDRGRDYIRRMVGGVERMQALIADLLRYSRAGRTERAAEPVAASEVVAGVLDDLQEAINDRGADVRIGELPTVLADRNGLQQVFQNLISNALKFANGGTPVVEVGATDAGENWRFWVADNGIGIHSDQRDKVFAAFERLHSRDDYPGTGIGLAIVKKIVERHGGRIAIEDGIDGGSRFVFELPRGEEKL
jgi:PAS domain S-box-containing protein